MTPIRRARRVASVLAGLAFAWLALAVAAPAAFAEAAPPLGVGGMAGWQIALIAVGAALAAATAALLLDRTWTARRKPVTSGA